MDTKGSNLEKYIQTLENALKRVKEGTSDINIDEVYRDLDNCNKTFQFLLSDKAFPDVYSNAVLNDCPHIMEVERIEEGKYRFILDRLLPHRLDYHKIGLKTAGKINHTYGKNFQRDTFEFINSKEFQKYDDKDKCIVAFINYYDPAEKLLWDNDNLDVKVFIDYVISGKFIKDDGHDKLSYMMLSKEGNYTHTEAYLFREDELRCILDLLK